MSRTCTICSHSDREEIDRQLASGTSYRNIAEQFGTSIAALSRHREHIPKALAQAHEAQEVARADDLLEHIRSLQARTLSALEKAEREEEIALVFKGIREARENLKLLGEVAGQLQNQPQINFNQLNIYNSPEWRKVGEMLLEVLGPYPELRRRVAEKLLELAEGGQA